MGLGAALLLLTGAARAQTAAPFDGRSGAAGEAPPAGDRGPESLDKYADLSLEQLLDVVIIATKSEQRIEEAPSIVEVVTYQDIRRRGYLTVGDALRHVPGLFTIDDGSSIDVGVRGVFSSTGAATEIIKVMINGQPVAFRPTASPALGYDLVPIESVQRIEIMRGAGSALYGANAFLGVINIVTFQGTAEEAEQRPNHSVAVSGELRGNEAGLAPGGTASFLSTKEIGNFRYLVTAGVHRGDRSGLVTPLGANGPPSPGWDAAAREYIAANAVTRNDTELAASAYGLTAYRLPHDFAVQVDGNLQYSARGAEFQDFSFLTHRTRLTQMNGYARARLTYGASRPTGLSASLAAVLSAGAPTGGEEIVDRFLVGAYKRRQFGYRAFDLSTEVRYAFDAKSSVTLGFDFAHDREDLLTMQIINERTGVTETEPGMGSKLFDNAGAYGQVVWNPWSKLTFTAGARIDRNSVVACDATHWSCLGNLPDQVVSDKMAVGGGRDESTIVDRGIAQLSSRFAAVYAFPVLHAYAKLIYGSSFKPPSPFQLYHRPLTLVGSSVGNPTLKPQTADTFEATVGLKPIPELSVALVGFVTRIDEAVVFLKQGSEITGRNADVGVSGVEANVGVDWSAAVSTFLNASAILESDLEPEQRRDETDLAWRYSPLNASAPGGRYPDFMMHAGVNLRPASVPLNVNLTASLIGARRATSVNKQLYNYLDFEKTYTLPAYVSLGLTVSSVGLKPFSGFSGETVLSAGGRYIPGGAIEPGYGGIDIPSPGPTVFLRMEQRL